jgi:hypothetical protein
VHSQRANFNPNPTGGNLGRYSGEFLVINGETLPMVRVDSGKQTVATMVSDARNAQGVFIGQKIGRDQSKVEYTASVLTAQEWSKILMMFERSFVNDVTFFDMVRGRKVTRKMYVNDRTAIPLAVDEEGNVTAWKDCALNLIDTGM